MLTDAQMTDVRRFAGYWLSGTVQPVNANTDTIYMHYGMVYMSLYTRLTSLTAAEETVLTTKYLTPIAQLESDILSAAANLDTDAAAVWTHNKNEVADRTALFRQWCLMMCQFIGVKPGPGLKGGTAIVRC